MNRSQGAETGSGATALKGPSNVFTQRLRESVFIIGQDGDDGEHTKGATEQNGENTSS